MATRKSPQKTTENEQPAVHPVAYFIGKQVIIELCDRVGRRELGPQEFVGMHTGIIALRAPNGCISFVFPDKVNLIRETFVQLPDNVTVLGAKKDTENE